MTEGSARAKRIFLSLIEMEPERRGAFLDRECADDPALRENVENLLAAHVETEGLPVRPAFERFEETTPDRVGAYRILDKLGEGGFGLVYRAEQEEPVRREVALKLLKRGMDSEQIVARFDAERQALAVMDHPGIATVFDAGTTDDGRPYFVMELVRGVPLTDHVERNGLDVERRLQLFLDVCAAVQHAHNKGVIHRDLKPSNLLVAETDGEALPRVIDFGIAKAVSPDGSGEVQLTQADQFMGTPAYMSPEQAVGAASVDTRSDVYSLGVVLYEMLTGELPFDLEKAASSGRAEVVRVLREEEPPRPSTRVTGSAAADRRERASRLRGDLDWIVMRALEKEPERRYETVGALAADVRRHLAFEPVVAGPPSTRYRLSKFVRRNRAAVAAGVVVLVGLAIGLAVSIHATQRATEAAREAQAINDFLVDLISQADPWQSGGQVSVRTALDRSRGVIDESFRNQPRAAGNVRFAIAEAYQKLGDFEAAARTLEESLNRLRGELGEDDVLVLEAEFEQALMLVAQDSLEVAAPRLEAVHGRILDVLGPDHALAGRSWTGQAQLATQLGDLEQADDAYREALTLLADHPELDPVTFEHALKGLGWVALLQGNVDRADSCFTAVRALLDDDLGARHPRILEIRVLQGYVTMDRQRTEAADELFRELIVDLVDVLGEEHPLTMAARSSHTSILTRLEKYEEATESSYAVWKAYEAAQGETHSNTLITKADYGENLATIGRTDESKRILHEVLETRLERFGPEHREVAVTYGKLHVPYLESGDREQAVVYLEKAIELQREASGGELTPDLRTNLNAAASSYVRLGRFQDAIDATHEYYAKDVENLGPDHPRLAGSNRVVAWALDGLGRHEAADSVWTECLRLRELGGDAAAAVRAEDLARSAGTLVELGRLDEAEDRMERALTEWIDAEGNAQAEAERRAIALLERYRAEGRTERADAWERRLNEAMAHPGPVPAPTMQETAGSATG